MPESIPRRLDALSDTAHDLVEAVNELNKETDTRVKGVSKRLRRNQVAMWFVVGSFVLDVVLTTVLAFNLHTTSTNTDNIKNIQAQQTYAFQVTRRKVLCPLYRLLEEGNTPEARKTYPQGPEKFDQVYKIIDDGYNALNCSAPLPKGPVK